MVVLLGRSSLFVASALLVPMLRMLFFLQVSHAIAECLTMLKCGAETFEIFYTHRSLLFCLTKAATCWRPLPREWTNSTASLVRQSSTSWTMLMASWTSLLTVLLNLPFVFVSDFPVVSVSVVFEVSKVRRPI